MARYDFMVLSRCTPGQEQAYEDWYVSRHLVDVCNIEGVESARLTRLRFQKVYDLDAPQWGYLTHYVLDDEDPQAVIDRIMAVSDTEAMPLSPHLNKEGMVQAIGETVGVYP